MAGQESTQQHAVGTASWMALVVLGVPLTILGIAWNSPFMYYFAGSMVAMALVVAAVTRIGRWI